MIETPLLNRQNDERVPRTGVLEIGFGEVSAAIGMRVVDADQVELLLAGFAVGAQQIFGPQFVAGALRAGGDVVERERVDGRSCCRRRWCRSSRRSIRWGKRPGRGSPFRARGRVQCWIILCRRPRMLAEILVGAVAEDGYDHARASLVMQFLCDLKRGVQRCRPPRCRQAGLPRARGACTILWQSSVSMPDIAVGQCRVVDARDDGRRHVLGAFDAVEAGVGLDGDAFDAGQVAWRRRDVPMNVPLVPSSATKWVMRPSVCAMISGAVVLKCACQLASLPYWLG